MSDDAKNGYEDFPYSPTMDNNKLVDWINKRMADPSVYSVEILRKNGGIILRVWNRA